MQKKIRIVVFGALLLSVLILGTVVFFDGSMNHTASAHAQTVSSRDTLASSEYDEGWYSGYRAASDSCANGTPQGPLRHDPGESEYQRGRVDGWNDAITQC
jgi:hypothetical protein